jgi:hypothetical protein
MALFRKKPVVVEAVLWDGNQLVHGAPEWISEALRKPPGAVGSVIRVGNTVHIHTLEGRMDCSAGDWIIQGVKGELYSCKPDIFAATYEPASGVDSTRGGEQ